MCGNSDWFKLISAAHGEAASWNELSARHQRDRIHKGMSLGRHVNLGQNDSRDRKSAQRSTPWFDMNNVTAN